MKKVFLFVVIALVINNVQSQTSAKSIYAELGGPSIAGLNFDMRLNKKEDGLGARVGIGGFQVDGEGALFFPLGLNYLFGKDRKNYFELGAGATFVNVTGNAIDGDLSTTFGHLSLGYRYQPAQGGFLFRAAVTPIFGKGFFVPYYAGISFGYKF
jgi:hypothetical protein